MRIKLLSSNLTSVKKIIVIQQSIDIFMMWISWMYLIHYIISTGIYREILSDNEQLGITCNWFLNPYRSYMKLWIFRSLWAFFHQKIASGCPFPWQIMVAISYERSGQTISLPLYLRSIIFFMHLPEKKLWRELFEF